MKFSSIDIFMYVANGNACLVQRLLSAGVPASLSVRRCDQARCGFLRDFPPGATLLSIAAETGSSLETVLALLDAGACVHQPDHWGNVPLHMACESGHLDIALVLLKAGADINVCNEDGHSPLFCACEANAIDVIETLLTSGSADLAITRSLDGSPIGFACTQGFAEILAMFSVA